MKSKYFSILLFSIFLLSCNRGTQPRQAPNQGTNQPQPTQAVQQSIVYTADEGGSISKINASTNTLAGTIKVEGAVHNVQISPDGRILGATQVPEMDEHSTGGSKEMNGFALFYDTATDTLTKKVEVGLHPAHIVFTADGKYALVTNNESNNVTVIDLASYTVLKSIPTGKGPHGFRISKDSKFAYVANMDEDTVSVLDLVNMTEMRKITVGKTPVTTSITDDGKTLLATVNAENSLAVIDLASDKIDKITVGVGPAQVLIGPDNKFAYVANQGTEENPSYTVSKIDMATKGVTATINTGKGAHGISVSSDNKFVYVTNMFEDTVSVIDISQNKTIAVIKVGKTPNGITFKQ